MNERKLVILGLDCVPPELVFDEWRDKLPHLKGLMEGSLWGKLRSTIPPITVPAWTAMMTSHDPGMLGIYGFRNRSNYGYDDLYFANAKYVKAKTVWNYLSRNRMRSLVLGVPQTYPPKPLNGIMVSSFLTPNKDVQFTYPDEIKGELEQAAGGNYVIDVENFRTDKKTNLLKQIYDMTEARFKAFRHFLEKDDFDFAMMVEMGTDRIHHAFWRFMAKDHRLYEPGNPFENAIYDYYLRIDEEIGKTLELLDDNTSVMVVSDHGAKTMVGAICVNEWLQNEGLLKLKSSPTEQTRLKMNMIDWNGTKAWGEGGYYCRLFMNVEGREPSGTIPEADYEKVRDDIKARLEAIEDDNGRNIGTRVYKPEEIYKTVNNIAPDLIVYFGDLDWRSADSVGTGSVHLYENDTGPDDANHAQEGMIIWKFPDGIRYEEQDVYSIYDVAPTILKYFGIDIPSEMIGTPMIGG